MEHGRLLVSGVYFDLLNSMELELGLAERSVDPAFVTKRKQE